MWRYNMVYNIASNNVKAAAILLEAGSDVNGLGADGVTPLMIASALDHVKMLKLLMAHPSINLNAQVRTRGGCGLID